MSLSPYHEQNRDAAMSCQFDEDFDDFCVSYDIDWGEDGLGEIPDSGDALSDVYISVRGSYWMELDGITDEFHDELVELAKTSIMNDCLP
jgi:hypothetical protein